MSDPNRLGDMAELRACAWLMQQGYEVFRNVGSTGPADLVAWNTFTGDTKFIDVKTASKRINSKGEVYYNYAGVRRHNKVDILVFCPDENRFFWKGPAKPNKA